MKHALLSAAAAAALGLGLTMASVHARTALPTSRAPDLNAADTSDLSSARKRRQNKAGKARATARPAAGPRDRRNAGSLGEDRREQSGSGM
jgi:hypothetical protein